MLVFRKCRALHEVKRKLKYRPEDADECPSEVLRKDIDIQFASAMLTVSENDYCYAVTQVRNLHLGLSRYLEIHCFSVAVT